MIKTKLKSRGYFLIQVLVFGAVGLMVITGLISFAVTNALLSRKTVLLEQAFETAESGIEYYRWHLAHAPSDYTNGTGQAGPYVKNFYDRNNNLIGTYSLDIIAPPLGSTLVTIKSTGTSAIDATAHRTIIAKLAIPSFGNYAVASNSNVTFGQGTEVFGPIHSNFGISFEGLAHNLITSAVSSYQDSDHTGGPEFGVHTHVRPPPATGLYTSAVTAEEPPNPVQARPDVFIAGRSFPAPVVNFANITTSLTQMKTDAQASGKYIDASGVQGYKIVLKTNNTFDIYKVNSLVASPNNTCSSNTNGDANWGTWSVNATTFVANYPIPANGLVFVNDKLWVEGQINHSRVTIVAATLPYNSNTSRSITVNNNLLYTNYDGTDVIALIAQEDINAGMQSLDTLRIDGALIAQNGRIGRYYYSGCGVYDHRTLLTLYGTLISAQRYGFAYSNGTGYATRNLIYDGFLLFGPPPSFPTITNYYQIIYWKEVI